MATGLYETEILYLKKLKELKGYCPTELEDIYDTLMKGHGEPTKSMIKKLNLYMENYPFSQLLHDLERETTKRAERKLMAERWLDARSRYQPDAQPSHPPDDQKDILGYMRLVDALLQIVPTNKYLSDLNKLLKAGQTLTKRQILILDYVKKSVEYALPNETNVSKNFIERMRTYVERNPHQFVKRMLDLVEDGVKLTQKQIIAVNDIMEKTARFDEKYMSERMMLERINRTLLTKDQQRRFKQLVNQYKKARNYGKFYDQHAETRFLKELEELTKEVVPAS